MDKQYAIFDMDGTLIDSMTYWQSLAHEFLEAKGVAQIPQAILEQIKPMTMVQSATLFIQTFGLSATPEQLVEEMNAMMDGHYRQDIPLKPGVADYLHGLKVQGANLCVASATASHLMEACLVRLNVRDCFDFVLSCETKGVGKDRPDIYLEAAHVFGVEPANIAVYEDALYAAQTAKKAGFYLVGVYDQSAQRHWVQLQSLADETIYFEEDSL